MIYITGDTHGGFQRFGSKYFPQQTQMGRNDYMIICGDFGGWLRNPSPPCSWTETMRTSTC